MAYMERGVIHQWALSAATSVLHPTVRRTSRKSPNRCADRLGIDFCYHVREPPLLNQRAFWSHW